MAELGVLLQAFIPLALVAYGAAGMHVHACVVDASPTWWTEGRRFLAGFSAGVFWPVFLLMVGLPMAWDAVRFRIRRRV